MTNRLFARPGGTSRREPSTVISLVLAALAVMTAACGGGGGAAGEGAAAGGRGAMPPMPVEAITLTEKPVDEVAEFVGVVRSQRSTTIQPQAEGILTKILVTSGARVTQGTPLFEIDAAAQQAAVASLESVRAAREADALFARQQADRAKNLLSVGAVSQQELEQAQTLQKTADAQLRAVEQQIEQQRTQLGYFRVTAPTTGIIGDIPVRVGALVTKATELTTIDQQAGLEIYVQIPVQQSPRLRVGLPVRVLDEQNQVISTERVNFVAPSVDDATQTILIKAPITSGSGRFRTSQFVRTHVVFGTSPGLTVPVVSVTRINGQYFAFVAEAAGGGKVARQRALNLGNVVGNEYVVVSGLKAGEELIVSGIQKIGDGSPVQTAAPKPAGAGPGAAGAAGTAGGSGGR